MNEKEEGILLGKLIAFEKNTIIRLDKIEKKVDSLDRFKIKVTVIVVLIMGSIEVGFRVLELVK